MEKKNTVNLKVILKDIQYKLYGDYICFIFEDENNKQYFWLTKSYKTVLFYTLIGYEINISGKILIIDDHIFIKNVRIKQKKFLQYCGDAELISRYILHFSKYVLFLPETPKQIKILYEDYTTYDIEKKLNEFGDIFLRVENDIIKPGTIIKPIEFIKMFTELWVPVNDFNFDV